jgi:hypothetical protein
LQQHGAYYQTAEAVTEEMHHRGVHVTETAGKSGRVLGDAQAQGGVGELPGAEAASLQSPS